MCTRPRLWLGSSPQVGAGLYCLLASGTKQPWADADGNMDAFSDTPSESGAGSHADEGQASSLTTARLLPMHNYADSNMKHG